MAKPFYSVPKAVGQIMGDWQWNLNDITYSFPGSTQGNFKTGENAGFTAMTGFQMGMARAAFDLWDDLVAVNLTETTGWGAEITMAYSSTTDDNGSYAAEYADQSQIWYSTTDTDMIPQNAYYSQPGMWGYLHEIGHALGLDHPGPYDAAPGVDLTYEKNAVYQQDTFQYTVMSYFEADPARGDHTGTVNGTERYIHPSTPMLHDIATIQWMYGADLQTRKYDTVYGFNNTSGRDAFDFVKNPTPVAAIWDAGGTDTLDLSSFTTRQVVDLNPGAYSSVGDAGLTNNLAMAYAVDSYGRIQGLHSNFNQYGIVNYIENAKGGSGNDEITGNAANNEIHGNGGHDKLYGAGGRDWLIGGEGNDELLGGGGDDFMQGGAGNDTYYVEEAGDAVSEFVPFGIADAGGIDEVKTWRTNEQLTSYVENLTYLGATLTSQDFTGTGNGLANIITGGFANDKLYGLGGIDTLNGGAGRDLLDGGTEADVMRGGAGDDTYYVDNAGDQVIEYTRAARGRFVDTGGVDEVKTTLASHTLERYVENLTFTGTGAFHGIGNDLGNVMRGGTGADILEGGLGADTFYGSRGSNRFIGGEGNDTYHLGSMFYYGINTIVENADEGIDTAIYHAVSSSLNISPTLADNVENLTIVGSYNVNGTGNALANVMIGNAADNTLRGLGGDDTLDGGAGFDTLIGGIGDDTYRVGSTIFQKPDTIVEEANEGTDTVIYTPVSSLSSIVPSYTLGDNLENLTLGGALDADGIGNDLANVIVGNVQSNTLSGLEGNDTLDGGLGFDALLGGNGDDTLVGTYQYSVYGVDYMDGGQGTDTADFGKHGHAVWIDLEYPGREVWTMDRPDLTGGTWRQVADLVSVENLIGTAGADQMWGDSSLNVIYGGGGADTIDGRAGNDVLHGGFALEGDSRGGDGNDTILGGAGNDTIFVSYGSDVVYGGADIDMLSFGWVGGDVVADLGLGTTTFRESGFWQGVNSGGGWSTLVTVTWSEIENLAGGLGNDALTGDAGDNRIEGGAGNDTIKGLGGSDVLADIDSGDTIDGGEGYDFVYASARTDATGFQFAVAGSNVEYVNGSEGSDMLDATGLGVADFTQLHGDAGDDVFRLGDGIDWVIGGSGHDTLVFTGNLADYTIVEDQWEWTGWTGITHNETGVLDWVLSVETLQFADATIAAPGARAELVGTGAGETIAGTALDEEIFGGDGDDELVAGGGEDILFGGRGADRFRGGEATDVFYVDNDDTLIDGGAGFDYVYADDSQGPLGLTIDLAGKSIENVYGGVGNDVIDASGMALNDFDFGINAIGDEGDDTIIGSAFDDYVVGGAGTDTMVYLGNRADYTVVSDETWSAGGTRVTHNATGVSDWVYEVEIVKFADVSMTL